MQGGGETMQHLVECIGEGWYRWRLLYAKDGSGLKWLFRVVESSAARKDGLFKN